MVFLDPSLRTRTSFETAMFLHGGHAVVLEPGKGSWTPRDRARRGDGRRHRRAPDRRRPRARPLRRRARGARLSPRHRLGGRAREDRVIRGFAAALREAGDQSRVGPPPSLPGARRRDDAAREARRDRREAVRARLGVAPEGAADRRAGERGARRGAARHGDRHRPARRLRARPGGHRARAAHRAAARRRACTSSTTSTRRWSAPTRCT